MVAVIATSYILSLVQHPPFSHILKTTLGHSLLILPSTHRHNPFFPQIHKLACLHFKITGFLFKTVCRHIYKARCQSGAELAVKLARLYSHELYRFCANLGYVPKLYAAQEFSRGFLAIAMEYLAGVTLEFLQWHITPTRRDK